MRRGAPLRGALRALRALRAQLGSADRYSAWCPPESVIWDAAKGIVRGADGKDPRVLKLSELRFVDSPTPPRELTTTVLEQYLFAAGVNKRDLDYAANKKNYAAHLIRLLESDQATEAQWSPTEGKFELRGGA